MKRVVVCFLLLFLTGCSTKEVSNEITTIKCHMNTNEESRDIRTYMVGNFIDNVLDNYYIESTIEGDNKVLQEDEEFYSWFYGDMSKLEGIDYKDSLDENIYTYKVIFNIHDIKDKSFNKEEIPSDIEGFKDYSKRLGYICND